jgi:enhancing lycopene biosynthesis protein 2
VRRIGILLAGCGRYDGTDAREALQLAAALERAGHRVVFMAPDTQQDGVVDHSTGELDEAADGRNVLAESARLTGGAVRDVSGVIPEELDGLVIPGGAGVVRNLCLSDRGPLGGGDPIPPVRRLLDALREKNAPVAGLGLARVVLLRHAGVSLADAGELPPPGQIVREGDGSVLYASGMMSGGSPAEIAAGIERLVAALGELL